MSDKPIFGPHALKADKEDSASSAADTPHFGVHSTSDQNTAPQAPINQSAAIHSTAAAKPKSASTTGQDSQAAAQAALNASKTVVKTGMHWFKQVLSAQPAGVWVKYFIISAIGLWVFTYDGGLLPVPLAVLDFLLYPLTATIFRAMGDFFHHTPGQVGDNIVDNATFSMIFFGDGMTWGRTSTLLMVFYWIIRFCVFMLKFVFSFVIGPLAFLFLLHKVRKAEKRGQQ